MKPLINKMNEIRKLSWSGLQITKPKDSNGYDFWPMFAIRYKRKYGKWELNVAKK